MFNYKIIKKIKDTKMWPGIAAVEFEGQIFYTDKKGNKTYSSVSNITVSTAVYKLIEYFQTHPYSEELDKLIDDFGDEKYSAGIDNASEDY